MTGPARDVPGDGSRGGSADGGVVEARREYVGLIGARIRELRHDRMTLAQLSAASSVSVGLLSRLENGIGNPSFAALAAIARTLDTDVESFFERTDERSRVLSPQDRVTLSAGDGQPSAELLVPSFDNRIVGIVLTLPPEYEPDDVAAGSPGEQFETVLAGSVEYRIDHEIHHLERDDSILFEASRPHHRRNQSPSSPARLLVYATRARLTSLFPGLAPELPTP